MKTRSLMSLLALLAALVVAGCGGASAVHYGLACTELEAADFGPTAEGKREVADKARERWKGQVEKYEKKQMPELEAEAKGYTQKSDEDAAKAKELLDESHAVHAKADRFDLGELGLQLGVVLCSLAILTKGRGFWFAGLLSSAAGLAVALTGVFGLFLGGHH